MGVYIKGMKMPKSCSRCFCMATCRLWKNIMHPEFNRHRNCPLVLVPPHGRLIDADALIDKIINYSKHIQKDILDCNKYDMCAELITQLALAPTIIPADKEVQEEIG